MVGTLHLFNDRWLLNVRADIGAGDTESSWNALAVFGWKFGGDLDKALLFGWRHMEVEVEEERTGNGRHLRRPDRRCAVQFLGSGMSARPVRRFLVLDSSSE